MREGWTKARLGDLGKAQTGSTPKTSQKENFGDFIPFIKPADFFSDGTLNYHNEGLSEIGVKGSRLFPAGSLLMVCIGATIGKIGFCTKDVTANQQINSLTPKDGVLYKFLYYQMLATQFQSLVISSSGQATLPIINKTKWCNLPIWLPKSEKEQKRIVAILDEAFAGIDTAIANTEKNLANARELFDSYLNSIFTQRGEGWNEATIEEVCQLKSGTSVNKKLEKPSGEIAYVKVADMNFEGNGEEILSSSRFLHISDIGKNSIFPVGTTIFPKRGGAIATNKKRLTAIPICADLNVMGVIPTEVLLPKFLFFYFINVDMAKLSSGTSIPQINNYDIAPLKIPFPTSLEAQGEIIQKLEDLYAQTSALKYIYQQKLNSLTELKQSLLQKAFSGELTAEDDKLMDEAVA